MHRQLSLSDKASYEKLSGCTCLEKHAACRQALHHEPFSQPMSLKGTRCLFCQIARLEGLRTCISLARKRIRKSVLHQSLSHSQCDVVGISVSQSAADCLTAYELRANILYITSFRGFSYNFLLRSLS